MKPIAKVEPDTTVDMADIEGSELDELQADFDKLVAHCVTIGIGHNAIKRILEGK